MAGTRVKHRSEYRIKDERELYAYHDQHLEKDICTSYELREWWIEV